MSKLLINEPPLQVLPTLAKLIGLNEAIVLQQIHYWISNPKIGRVSGDRRWVRNSITEWKESNFPFWGEKTIRRIIKNLVEKGFIEASNLNQSGYDRTLWYTIIYSEIEEYDYDIPNHFPKPANASGQNDQMEVANVTNSLTETLTETPKKKREKEGNAPAPIEYPPHLDTPEFREVWQEFEAYKRGNRKPLSVVGRKRLLTKAAKYKVEDVIWLLNLCMDTGWAGLIWDRLDKRIADRERDGVDYRKEIRSAVSTFGRDRYKQASEHLVSKARLIISNMGDWSDICSMNEYQFEQAYRRAVKGG